MNRKWQLQKELKIIWKNRHKYHFRDSGEAFDDYVMCMYFGPKLINRYSNADMEAIINRLNGRRLGLQCEERALQAKPPTVSGNATRTHEQLPIHNILYLFQFR